MARMEIPKMKILVTTQHYRPEPFNISDICEELAARGHEVTVLTGLPNYPEGIFYDGYKDGRARVENIEGVRVVRSRLLPRKTGPIHRVINYYSFSSNASKMAKSLPSDFDVVFAYQTSPVMMARPALAYAKTFGAPVLLWCVDIWPECLTAGGIKKDSMVYNHYAKVSKEIYSAADALAVPSPAFADYLRDELGLNQGECLYLPQYAEDLFDAVSDISVEGYDPSLVNFTFAGNVGVAQSVDTIIKAASLLSNVPEIVFHIVGAGSELEHCKTLAKGLENVVFHGSRPLEDMPSYYAASDVMLATGLADGIMERTLPRKIQSYMAARKPIVASFEGEVRRVIVEANCGFCCAPEDAEGLARICVAMAESGEERCKAMGESGRRYYESNFSKKSFFEKLEGEFARLKGCDSCAL